jgi:hypothetical protein
VPKTEEKHLNGEHDMLSMVAPAIGSKLLIDWAILKFLYQY